MSTSFKREALDTILGSTRKADLAAQGLGPDALISGPLADPVDMERVAKSTPRQGRKPEETEIREEIGADTPLPQLPSGDFLQRLERAEVDVDIPLRRERFEEDEEEDMDQGDDRGSSSQSTADDPKSQKELERMVRNDLLNKDVFPQNDLVTQAGSVPPANAPETLYIKHFKKVDLISQKPRR